MNLLAPLLVVQSAAGLCGGAPAVAPQVTVVTGDALDEGGIVGRGPLYVAPDGHVFYLDIADARLKEFDPRGGFVRTLGRPGEGPGEFRNPTGVGGRGVVVWVREGATGRLTTFWRTGELAETVAIPAGPGTAVFGPIGRTDDFLATRAVPLDGETRSVQSSFVRLDRNGRVSDTIAVVRSRQDLIRVEGLFGPGSRYTGLAIFSDAPIIRTSPGADFIAQVERPAPERGQQASFRIERIEVASGSRASVDVPYEPVRVTDELIDATLRSSLEEMESGAAEAGLDYSVDRAREAIVEAMDPPEWLPPVRGLVIEADRSLWLERWGVLDGGRQLWCATDPDLTARAAVWLPVEFHLLGARDGRLWSLVEDRATGLLRLARAELPD